MPYELILRAAGEEDFPVMARISATARERYRYFPGFAYVAEAPPVSESRLRIGSAVVAESGNRLLGFALTRSVDGFLFLDNISAVPDARGVGSKLLHGVLSDASSGNCDAITLTTFAAPPWNGPWFRKIGFETMPKDRIGVELQTIIDRQATYLDPSTRETLWYRLVSRNS